MISTIGPRFQVSNSKKKDAKCPTANGGCVQLFEREKRRPIKNKMIRESVWERKIRIVFFSYFLLKPVFQRMGVFSIYFQIIIFNF